MSLLRLPPEILQQIFNHIGSKFFRQDLSRLTICKQWFVFARPILFKCVKLSREPLRLLIASGGAKESHRLKNSLEILDLELEGDYSHTSTLVIEPPDGSNGSLVPTLDQVVEVIKPTGFVNALNYDLAQLAIIVQRANRMHTLRIKARSSLSFELHETVPDYLSIPTMQALLSLKNLRVLVLDLSSGFLTSSKESGHCHHFCPAIGALLQCLRTLYLRVRKICPAALNPRDANKSLQLNTVIISLNHTSDTRGMRRTMDSKRCGPSWQGVRQLKASLQKQAEALEARMQFPKMIEVTTNHLQTSNFRGWTF